MKKDLKKFLIVFLGLLFVFFVVFLFFYYRSLFSPSNKASFSSLSQSINLTQESKPEDLLKSYQQESFISQDGKLEIKNLSGWFLLKNKEFIEKVIAKNLSEEYNLDFILLAQKIHDNKSANLTLSKGFSSDGKTIEEIINILKEATEKNETEMEILKTETNNNETLIDVKYKKTGEEVFISKEKIISLDEKNNTVYIISFFVSEKNWDFFKNEAETILSSCRIID